MQADCERSFVSSSNSRRAIAAPNVPSYVLATTFHSAPSINYKHGENVVAVFHTNSFQF